MEVSFSNSFKKIFHKRVKHRKLETIFWEKIEVFIKNPFDPKLRTHKLSGNLQNAWAFSVNHRLRVVFIFIDDDFSKAIITNVGTHDEVY